MSSHNLLEALLLLVLVLAAAGPVGAFVARVLAGEPTWLSRFLAPVERTVYKLGGVDSNTPMDARRYATALLVFNAMGIVFLLGLQLLQAHLPLNPAGLPSVSGWLALNTAVSFVTNTNWQAYSGEATMSYLTQMLGLGVQNFLSAATGIAVMAALARGLARKGAGKGFDNGSSRHPAASPPPVDLGNFWADVTRTTLYVLLPLSLVVAVLLVSQGVVQNFSAYISAATLDGQLPQQLPMGPAASQIAIKQLGTNGGGFFGVNSAHPFENPTALSNFIQLLALLLLPCSLPLTFGRMVGDRRHGLALFAAMSVMLLAGLGLSLWSEFSGNAALHGVLPLEGKETRFGVGSSVLWSVATTATSNGSVNAMHSSLSPLSGAVAMLNMMLGEVVFGGVGSGVYGILLFVIVAVFIAGLMVGRTPEYLGKKIEARDIKLAVVGVLTPSVVLLTGAAIAAGTDAGLAGLAHKGPHGLSEIVYAFASAAGNNGSAFAGLSANAPFYNGLLALAMFIGRYAVILPVLAIAGHLGGAKHTPPSSGTFPTDGPLFVGLLVATIVIVGALTFVPVLALGPVVEHLLMQSGRLF